MDNNAISGISQIKMVFTDSVINTYSSPYPVIDDEGTRSTFNVATLVNCKTLPTNITGLNGITPREMDFRTNPFLGCYSYNSRGEDGSTAEFFA